MVNSIHLSSKVRETTIKLTRLHTVGLVIIALNLMGCLREAPRDNIFDPDSPLFEHSGQISGSVTEQYPPYLPLDSVRVTISPENAMTMTDSKGEFDFSRLVPDMYTLRFRKELYQEAQDSIQVKPGELSALQIRLNGQPQIDSVILITKHITHWWPLEDEYILSLEVMVSDRDGDLDIDTLFIKVDYFDFFRKIPYQFSPGIFTAQFFDTDFLPYSFAELPGENITILCTDIAGSFSVPSNVQVSRIITPAPEIISPGNLALVDSIPVFRWSSFDAGFQITYSVDVYRLDESGVPQFILGSDPLSSNALSWNPSIPLASARYYWTLSVTDRFGNISVSKEATFIVQ